MKFPDGSGVPVNMLPISDGSAFDQLKLLVDREGDNLAGPDWLGMLAAIGIVKGQPFTPDAHTREILDRAAKTGYKMSRVIGFADKVKWSTRFSSIQTAAGSIHSPDGTPANPRRSCRILDWENVAGTYPYLDLDARIWMFTDYYSISPGMVSKSPGTAAMYVIAFTDSEGTLPGGRQQLPPESARQHSGPPTSGR